METNDYQEIAGGRPWLTPESMKKIEICFENIGYNIIFRHKYLNLSFFIQNWLLEWTCKSWQPPATHCIDFGELSQLWLRHWQYKPSLRCRETFWRTLLTPSIHSRATKPATTKFNQPVIHAGRPKKKQLTVMSPSIATSSSLRCKRRHMTPHAQMMVQLMTCLSSEVGRGWVTYPCLKY